MTTLTLGYRAIGHKIKTAALPAIHWKSLLWLVSFFFLASLVAYIILVNQLTRGAFLIKDYNRTVDNLISQSKNLETSFAESGFLGNVQQKAAALSFEKTTKVSYVKMLDNSLTLAK